MSRLIEATAAFTLIPVYGTVTPQIPEDQRQQGQPSNSTRVYVDPGVYFITLDWNSSEQVSLSLLRSSSGVPWESLLTLPAGVGARSAHTKLVVSEQAVLSARIENVLQSTVSAKFALGLSIIRIGE